MPAAHSSSLSPAFRMHPSSHRVCLEIKCSFPAQPLDFVQCREPLLFTLSSDPFRHTTWPFQHSQNHFHPPGTLPAPPGSPPPLALGTYAGPQLTSAILNSNDKVAAGICHSLHCNAWVLIYRSLGKKFSCRQRIRCSERFLKRGQGCHAQLWAGLETQAQGQNHSLGKAQPCPYLKPYPPVLCKQFCLWR